MGLLQRIFNSKKTIINLPWLVDVHSHLIPGIDDGAQTVEESIELVRGLTNLGIKKIITTPHILRGTYSNTPQGIRDGLEKLIPLLRNAGLNVTIEVAAEYYFDDYFIKSIVEEDLIYFGDRHVLFELPTMMKPSQLEEAIFEMNTRGYIPVLAHPERYTYMYDPKLEQYDKIRSMGVLFQMNLLSLVGYYSKPIQKAARELVKANMVDLVGTDMHHKRHLETLPSVLEDAYVARLLNNPELLNHKLLS